MEEQRYKAIVDAVRFSISTGARTFGHNTVTKLVAYIDILREDRQKLLNALEQKPERELPVLPREVAEALEEAKDEWTGDYEQIAWMIPGADKTGGPCWKALFKYGNEWDGGFFEIVDALRYGYTVEEPAKFVTNRTVDDSEVRAIRNWYKGALLRINDGTDPDGFAKEAIEEVALYLGGAELLDDLSRSG